MLKPCVIAFLGPVGSGKSTQMRLLAKDLKAMGFDVKVVQFKTGNLWAYSLYRVASAGWPILKNRHLFKLWMILEVLAISFKFLIWIWLPLKARRIILVEEYLPAIAADYLYIARINGHQPKDVRVIISYVYKLAVLVPFISVFLDADNSVLKKRWKLRGTPDEKTGYISMQRKLLPLFVKLLSQSFIFLNTSDSTIKEINYRLREHLIRLVSP